MDIVTPIEIECARSLRVGDQITLSGYIYTGRDAVLPRLVRMIKDKELDHRIIKLAGSVIFHTAVSQAGVGPTSSNKPEIEESLAVLSKAGVRLHLGKGKISDKTVKALQQYDSVYAVIPPVTALLQSRILSKQVIAFPEEGMEAIHLLKVSRFPAIIAAGQGVSIY